MSKYEYDGKEGQSEGEEERNNNYRKKEGKRVIYDWTNNKSIHFK